MEINQILSKIEKREIIVKIKKLWDKDLLNELEISADIMINKIDNVK